MKRLPVAAILGMLVYGLSVQAWQSRPVEYEVKAAFLYNFSRFVKWPTNADGPNDSFNVCVLGRDPFGTALDKILEGESVNGRKVAARRISKPQEANCHILYISSSEDSRLKDILDSLPKAGTLTVSDIPQFIDRGGMIQFVLEGNKVRFEVNLIPAERNGLTLSSDLLKVAVNVRRNPGD